jgi:hypothetical protein
VNGASPAPSPNDDARARTDEREVAGTTRIYTYGPKGGNGTISARRIAELEGTFRFSRPKSKDRARRSAEATPQR